MLYTYMEHVVFNQQYGLKEWMSREELFGISENLDEAVINNFHVVDDLFTEGGLINNEGFQFVPSLSNDECFCLFYNKDPEKLLTFLNSPKYQEYNTNIKKIADYLDWKHSSVRLIELSDDINISILSFNRCAELWEEATPVLPE